MTTIPETPANYDEARVIERPDGFYWESKDSGEVFGPFTTLVEAIEDMQFVEDTDYEPGETLEEAEEELGISGWIDPETGLPGEESPRLED
ncbi:MAG TPA: hypothetical protein DEP05_04235 [Betaproteobacteria bacterium]|nr:hypothetical protein [Betaproteobacteria bacterium]